MTDSTPRDGKSEAHLRWVPVHEMKVSPVAQRQLNTSRVDYLAANFNPDLLGTPTVNERDGHFHIIDGQHRIEALKQIGWGDQKIECKTYVGLTDAEEAEKFDRLNDTLRVGLFDRFRIRVTAGRPVETTIEQTVRAQGLVISTKQSTGAVGCVGTLRKVYMRSDADTLGMVLRIIRDAYGDAGLVAAVVDGIAHLCQRYSGQLDEDVVIQKLAKAHGGVNGLLAKAELLRKQTGRAKSHCVAAAAVEIINSGRGGKKIPSWWSA